MKLDFLTPVGRLVQGDPFEAQTKDQQGKPLMTQGGQPTQKYFIAVAFPKTDAAFGTFYGQMQQAAKAAFPHLFDAAGNCTHPRFSWKLIDGDGMDDNGKSNANKEGFAGHWVVKFASTFPPKCFYAGRYQPHEQIQDKNAIPRGFYVRVAGTMEGNGQTLKPGLYMNLNMVELAAEGVRITSGPDAGAVFGAFAPALPSGASPLPINSGAPVGNAMPGLPASAPAAPALPPIPSGAAPMAPLAAPGVATSPISPPPALPVTPNPAILATPVPARQLTAAANGHTYESLIAGGWTDEMLRANGLML